jgi:hypothetical protein
MESWMVSTVIALVAFVSTFAVLKTNVQRLNKVQDENLKKIDNQHDDLIVLKEKISRAPNMRDVRTEFVSKEFLTQMQKNIDDKFERLESGINKILTKLEK